VIDKWEKENPELLSELIKSIKIEKIFIGVDFPSKLDTEYKPSFEFYFDYYEELKAKIIKTIIEVMKADWK